MPPRTLRVQHCRDAERPEMHSHAERGNDQMQILLTKRRKIHIGPRRSHVLQIRILVRTQFQAQRCLALAFVANHQTFELFAQEHRRHFQVQQLIGGRGVQQQVNPLVLTDGQARHRQVEPPDIAVTVQFGEVAVVGAEHGAAQFLVATGDGLGFIELHDIPANRCAGLSARRLSILGATPANIKRNLHATTKCQQNK